MRSVFQSTCPAALVVAVLACAWPAHGARLRDLCEVQGARGNVLKGMGLVVGLAGTGDKSQEALRAQSSLLERLDIEVAQTRQLASDNVAVVAVTATFPPFAKEGTRIDVMVHSFYDAESLSGGTLMNTQLKGDDGQVYAVAQGPVSVGGASAAGGGAAVTQNHVTAGRVPMGAYIEREIPSTITDGERIMLLIKRPDFITARNIRERLETELGAGSALAMGAGAINVRVPEAAQGDLIGFIAQVLEYEVETVSPAKVVINERTGTVVVGGDVVVKPCQVAHGSLTITIQTEPFVVMPPPFTDAEAVVGETTDINLTEQPGSLMPLEGTSAKDVAYMLNQLKVTPRDMIAIFQALRESGALEADLEIM